MPFDSLTPDEPKLPPPEDDIEWREHRRVELVIREIKRHDPKAAAKASLKALERMERKFQRGLWKWIQDNMESEDDKGFCMLGAAYHTGGQHQGALTAEYLAHAIQDRICERDLEYSEHIVSDYNDEEGRTLLEILAVIGKAKAMAKRDVKTKKTQTPEDTPEIPGGGPTSADPTLLVCPRATPCCASPPPPATSHEIGGAMTAEEVSGEGGELALVFAQEAIEGKPEPENLGNFRDLHPSRPMGEKLDAAE